MIKLVSYCKYYIIAFFAIFFMVFAYSELLAQSDFWRQTSGPYYGYVIYIEARADDIFAGVFRSTDNGNSWERMTPNAIYDLTINLSGYLFAADWSDGVYRSVDNGVNWQLVLDHSMCSSITTVSDSVVFVGTTIGIFRSLDYGQNWAIIGLYPYNINDINANSQGHIFAILGGAVYRSTDLGETWNYQGTAGMDCNSLVFNSQDHIYCGDAQDINSGGVYKSTDDGVNWTRIFENAGVLSVELGPDGNVYAGTMDDGLFYSNNDGQDWLNIGLTNNIIKSIKVKADGNLFAGTRYNGLFFSGDNGDNWEAKGPTSPRISYISKHSDNSILVATPAGTYKKSSDGNWSRFGGWNIPVSGIITTPGNVIFAAISGGCVFRSTDTGQNWDVSLCQQGKPSFCISSTGDLYLGLDAGLLNGGVFVTSDQGISWDTLLTIHDITSMAINSIDHIYIGCPIGANRKGIYRSVDGGINWERIYQDGEIFALAIDEYDNIIAGSENVIIRSLNGGDTWVICDTLGSRINCLASIAGGYILAGTRYDGVYLSHNSGRNWSKLRSVFTESQVYSFYAEDLETVYAGCIGYGLEGGEWGPGLLTNDGAIGMLSQIWPGDLDNNGVVEEQDVLPLIDYWYEQVEPRIEEDFGWFGHMDFLWENLDPAQYADANGDGYIKMNDFVALCLNWGKTYVPVLESYIRDDFSIQDNLSAFWQIYEIADNNSSEPAERIKEFLDNLFTADIPNCIDLLGCYPNPFNSTVRIDFEIPYEVNATIEIYDILGRKVNLVESKKYETGVHSVIWEGKDQKGDMAASGVYFICLKSGDYFKVIKAILLR